MERERAERRALVCAMLWDAVGNIREESGGGVDGRGCGREDKDDDCASERTMKSRCACTWKERSRDMHSRLFLLAWFSLELSLIHI